jgi:hypothetical protein
VSYPTQQYPANPAEEFMQRRGGPPSLSFGDKFNHYRWANIWRGGRVIAEPTMRDEVDPDTNQPKVWPNGEKKRKMIITLECTGGLITLRDGTQVQVPDERDPRNPEDLGHRRLFVQGYMVDAMREAVSDAGVSGVHMGGYVYTAWTDEKPPSKPTFSPAKLYKGLYLPPAIAVPQGQTPPSTGLASQQPGGFPQGPQQGTPPPFGQPAPAPAFAQQQQGFPQQQPAAVAGPPPGFGQPQQQPQGFPPPQQATPPPFGQPQPPQVPPQSAPFEQARQDGQQAAAQFVTAAQQAGYQGPAYTPPQQPQGFPPPQQPQGFPPPQPQQPAPNPYAPQQ